MHLILGNKYTYYLVSNYWVLKKGEYEVLGLRFFIFFQEERYSYIFYNWCIKYTFNFHLKSLNK